MQIAGIAAVLLCTCLTMISYFQRGSNTIADVRLPSSLATAQLINGVNASNSHLRSSVLLGGKNESTTPRELTWRNEVEPVLLKLSALVSEEDSSIFDALSAQLDNLYVSQWWVEEMSQTVGNTPSRVLYEQDLLPMFERIQSALSGLDADASGTSDISTIRQAATSAQQTLSEAVRQLSEAVRTGSIIEIQEFRDETSAVRAMLDRLALQVDADDPGRSLLDWILREHVVYEEIANQIIALRQSEDWNRALFVVRTETVPLAQQVESTLLTLQSRHNERLLSDVADSALISRVGSILTIGMIFMLMLIAWVLSRVKARRLVAPIKALAEASDQLANVKYEPIEFSADEPLEIAHLTERFNTMGHDLIARTEDLENVNRELQTYTHIITHDLKPPLINIKGHTGVIQDQLEALRATADDPDISTEALRNRVVDLIDNDIPDSVGYINVSIARTDTLVSGILDHSRLFFRSIKIEPVDMNDLIDHVMRFFNHLASDVEFEIGNFPTICTDRFLVEHVFSNLIDNALKYLDRDRPGRIEIGGHELGDDFQFYVSDNGIGLERPGLDIFEMFTQSNGQRSGSGVGLALVKTTVTRLGGQVWHENNTDHGLRICFRLPTNSPG